MSSTDAECTGPTSQLWKYLSHKLRRTVSKSSKIAPLEQFAERICEQIVDIPIPQVDAQDVVQRADGRRTLEFSCNGVDDPRPSYLSFA